MRLSWSSCAIASCLTLAPAVDALRAASARRGASANSSEDSSPSLGIWNFTGSMTRGGEWLRMQNVCLNARSIASLIRTQYRQREPMEMAVLPYGSPGTEHFAHVNGTLLMLIVNHGFPWDARNIWHTAQGAFASFEGMKTLGEKADAVLAWQLSREAMREETFYRGEVQILGELGLNTPLFTREDVSSGRGVCAASVIRLAPTHEELLECPWFTGEAPRLEYRQRALDALGLRPPALPECRAVVVLREPPQGIANRDAVEKRLRAFMSEQGWALTVWRSDRWNREHRRRIGFEEQVRMFHKAALSIMVHGAENINMVWQPPRAGFVLVRKCGDGGQITIKHTHWMNFSTFRTYPANCTIEHPPLFNYTVNEHHMYYMDVDGDLLPALRPAMEQMEKQQVCRAGAALNLVAWRRRAHARRDYQSH